MQLNDIEGGKDRPLHHYSYLAKLPDLPTDILLQIVEGLPFVDAVSVILICWQLHRLSVDRSFWVTCLEIARITMPLACPSHEDFALHDLASLRNLTVKTLRRERNWSQAQPRVCGQVKSVSCETSHDLVIQVPGTQLVVGHSEEFRALTCWDVGSGVKLSSVNVGRHLCEVSPMKAAEGRVTVALLISDDIAANLEPSSLIVVTLEYGHSLSLKVTMEVTFTHELDHYPYIHRHLFIDSDVVGVIRVHGWTTLDILAFHMKSGDSALVPSEIRYDSKMGTSLLDGNVYIVQDLRDHGRSVVYICPSNLLPYHGPGSHNSKIRLHRDEIDTPHWTGFDASYLGLEVWFEPLGVLSADPSQTLAPLTTMHHIIANEEDEPRAINVRYWSFRPRSDDLLPFQRLSPTHSINVRGMLKRSWHSPVYSGIHILLLVQFRGSTSLRLVRYNPKIPSSSVHLLELPPDIDAESISSVLLDCHAGSVFVMVDSSVIFSIPYA